MNDLRNRLRRLIGDEDGPTAAEYAVMLAFIAGAIIAIVSSLGGTTASWWQNNADSIIEASDAASS